MVSSLFTQSDIRRRGCPFVFVETSVFTKRLARLGLEDALRGLQLELLENPTAGDLDPGTGGLRKVRMADPTRGKGKRGRCASALPVAAPQRADLPAVCILEGRGRYALAAAEESASSGG